MRHNSRIPNNGLNTGLYASLAHDLYEVLAFNSNTRLRYWSSSNRVSGLLTAALRALLRRHLSNLSRSSRNPSCSSLRFTSAPNGLFDHSLEQPLRMEQLVQLLQLFFRERLFEALHFGLSYSHASAANKDLSGKSCSPQLMLEGKFEARGGHPSRC